MKSMNDRKMDMHKGSNSEIFPSEPHMKMMKRPGEIKGFKYPDTEEASYSASEGQVKGISKNMPKSEYRH